MGAFGFGFFISYKVTKPTIKEVFDGTPESYSECILLCEQYMICFENNDGSIEKLTDWKGCSGLRINLRDKLKHESDFQFNTKGNAKKKFANLDLHFDKHFLNPSDFSIRGDEKKAYEYFQDKMFWKNVKNQEVRFLVSPTIKGSLISRSPNNSSEKEWEFVAWCSREEDVKKARLRGSKCYKHSKYFISFIGYLDFKR